LAKKASKVEGLRLALVFLASLPLQASQVLQASLVLQASQGELHSPSRLALGALHSQLVLVALGQVDFPQVIHKKYSSKQLVSGHYSVTKHSLVGKYSVNLAAWAEALAT